MKNLTPRALLRLVIAGLIAQTTPVAPQARAQEDFDNLFNDEELDAPVGTFNQAVPPPPPQQDLENTPPPPAGVPPDSSAAHTDPDADPYTNNFNDDTHHKGSGGSKATSRPLKPSGVSKPKISDAQIEDITEENYPDLIESFDYPNAEITDIIKAISQLTGKNFIVDPSVRGKISIVAPTQISVAEAYKAFLSALAINGFTVVPSGKFLKVKSARNAQRDSIETYSGQYYPNSDLMITRIIHLKHISAEEVNKRLRILASKDGEMTPYEPTNSLIVSDYGANIERVMKIINELDRPGFEEQLEVILIRHAKVKEMADLINQIISKDPNRGSTTSPPGFGAGVPRFRSRGGTPGGGTPEELSLVAPDERTNALIVVGNRAGIEKIRDLVKKLDYKLDPAESGGVFVYYVKYGEAEKIATTLSGLAQTSSTGGSGGMGAPGFPGGPGGFNRPASPIDRQAVFGGDVRIVADKNTNSLVITASKQDYEVVRNLLAKIDMPRDQVFVEGIIMEMNTDKIRSWNPTYYRLDAGSNGIGRAGFSSSGSLAKILNPQGDSGAILGFGGGGLLKFQIPGGPTVEVPSLLAFINLLQQNTESNILSTPQVLALDNEEAEIEVGDNIPIAPEQSSSANGTTSTTIKFEKATIKLTITPFIRPDSDVVRLKINQSVKQPTKSNVVSAKLADTTTVISDRAIKTNIVINNGDTAVLGGLIRDEETLEETKIPILGDIPVLGWLFKSQSIQKKKINLVIFLTPKIIRSAQESHELLSKKTNERIDWLKKNFSGRDPYGTKIDSLPRAAKTEMSDDGGNLDEPSPVEPRKSNR